MLGGQLAEVRIGAVKLHATAMVPASATLDTALAWIAPGTHAIHPRETFSGIIWWCRVALDSLRLLIIFV